MITRQQFCGLITKGVFGFLGMNFLGCYRVGTELEPAKDTESVKLKEPDEKPEVSLKRALSIRRSRRDFSEQKLSNEQISQLLWAAQGITDPARGFRTAPSAGALYPLELYIATEESFYHYLPQRHRVENLSSKDFRLPLYKAALSQSAVKEAPVSIVITAVYERTSAKYGKRASRYVHLEAGHAAQNILLQAVALELGGVPIGAFKDDEVQKVLSLPKNHKPMYIIPIGYPKEE